MNQNQGLVNVGMGGPCDGGGCAWVRQDYQAYDPTALAAMQQMQQVNQTYCGPFGRKQGPRRSVLGFGPLALTATGVAGSTNVPLVITCQQPFTGHALRIPYSIAVGLLINDIKVGTISQIVAGPLPAELFEQRS